jgi:glutamate synthase domain-containing protein 2
MSKLNDYLQNQKIDPRRILVASRDLEALRREDRTVRLAKKRAKGGDESAKEAAAKERRSGRPVSKPTLDRALSGGAVSSAAKTRIVRAVNAVLAQKKKGEAALRDLF